MHKLFSAILMATAAAATVACGNGKGEAEAEAEGTPLMMPFARTNVDTTMSILSIKDNEFEKAMPKKLFYGEADSAQVEKLWPGDSVPSSISCFVVEKDGKRALFDTGNGKAKGGKLVERLAMLGMEHRLSHKPAELSGGEQQRVAIARALINSPAVLLADEPSGNLDTKNKEEIHRLFFTLRDTLGQTVVIVTHDEQLAEMSDRKIQMVDGVIRP